MAFTMFVVLAMNVVRKPIVEEGVFSETQLGIIGSCLFFVYAVGKLTNGFLLTVVMFGVLCLPGYCVPL